MFRRKIIVYQMSSERELLPDSIYPIHYSLELEPDLVSLEFLCREVIRCETLKSTKCIVLHSKEISVSSASYETSTKTLLPIEISYHLVDTTVNFRFEEDIPLGEGVLKINFKGILNSDMAGFYKSCYTDADGRKKNMASTQFEALDARRAFPCWVMIIIYNK